MSGLLPRTNGPSQSGIFTDLSVQNLTVSLVGYINSLVVGTINIASLVLNSLTTNVINGNPNLNIVSGNTTINSVPIVDTNSIQTLTNKTINSANNTVQVNGTDINSLVNQDVRTTANPTFNNMTLSNLSVQVPNIASGVFINQSLNLASNVNGIDIHSNNVRKLQIGHNQNLDLDYISAIPGIRILTSFIERLRIPAAGILNDNSITNILGLNGTNLVFKDNMVDTDTAQTLTNKTINTLTNNIQVSAASNTNINLLINQALLLTSSPTFSNITLNAFAFACRANTVINTLSTTIVTAGVYVPINIGSTTMLTNNLFTTAGNTGIRYTGSVTRTFILSYNISQTTNGNQNSACRIVLNSAPLTQSTMIGHHHGGGVGIANINCLTLITVSNGDLIDLQISNLTNTAAIVTSWVNLVAIQLPGL